MNPALFIIKKILAFWFCYIAVLLSYWKWVEKKSLSELGLTRHIGNYFIGILTAVLLLLIIISVIIFTGNMKYHGILEKRDFFILVLFGGGFIAQGTMEVLPHWSSLFAGEKVYSVIGIINLIFISLIFSLLTICFQNIWAACGLHSFWNFILYSILGLNLSGKDDNVTTIFHIQSVGSNIWNGSIYGIEASVITTVILGVLALLL